MTKNDYRMFFASCKPMLKLKYFVEAAGVNHVTFYRFMKSEDFNRELSIEKLELIKSCITEILSVIA